MVGQFSVRNKVRHVVRAISSFKCSFAARVAQVPRDSLAVVFLLGIWYGPQTCSAEWKVVYAESFDQVETGAKTQSETLPQWEGGSAAGVVFDGRSEECGKILVAAGNWTSFNQGPILNLDLTAFPHDQVKVKFDLIAFGDWRGNQMSTGGPPAPIDVF